MKKIIALLLLICTFALCLVSCASMDKYEDNLDKNYDVEKIKKSEIDDLAEMLDLDMDDYDIEEALMAESKKGDDGVYIFECKSSSKAKKLAKDVEDALDEVKSYISDMEVTKKGKFVLIGTEDGIEDALGK